VQKKEQVYIGKLPLMLRSTFCALSHTQDYGVTDALECPLDPGGYFIINGSEKVGLAAGLDVDGPMAQDGGVAPFPFRCLPLTVLSL
jgi:hypothetical protein